MLCESLNEWLIITKEVGVGKEWVDVNGFEEIYEINDMGEARAKQRYHTNSLGHKRLLKGKILKKTIINNSPYFIFYKNNKRKKVLVRKCMFLSFNMNGDVLKSRNIDGDRFNNNKNNITALKDGFWFCGCCNKEKPIKEFYKKKNGKQGSSCYKCNADYHKTEEGRARKKISDRRYELKNIDEESFYFRDKINSTKFRSRHSKRLNKEQSEKYKNDESFRKRKLAMNKLYRQIKSGKIIKPDRCSLCHCSRHKVYGVIRDLDKPLDVEFLCTRCRGKEFRVVL